MRIKWRSNRTVKIATCALEQAVLISTAGLPKETGGILVGWRTNDDINVIRFLEVIDRQAGKTSYCRRYALAEAALAEVLALEYEGSPLGYVGEWHSHPKNYSVSKQDIKEFKSIAKGASGIIALVVLINNPTGGSWEPFAWVASNKTCKEAAVFFGQSNHGGER